MLSRRLESLVSAVPHGTVQPAEADTRLATRSWAGAENDTPLSSVQDVLTSPGQLLDPAARTFFEARFGHDFSRVRVHTDERAAASVRAVGAQAYTVGHHIAFASGTYQPRTAPGVYRIAHELTHVLQQSKGAPGAQQLRLGQANTAAEREADRAARAVVSGGPSGHVAAGTSHGTVQRAIGDVLAGGAVGAIAGAALGSIFGPLGALIGGGIGLLAGLAVGEVAGAERREMTSDERREAGLVFGSSLDMGKVHIAESSVATVGFGERYARTPYDTIYFPPGTSKLPFGNFMPWLVHELTHVWQYQHGVSVATKLWWALHGASAYDYGGESGLRAAAGQGKRFTEFNTEQQASIAADYYKAQRAGLDTSAYDPYIAQIRTGGVVKPAAAPAGSTPGPSAAPAGGTA